MAWTKLGAKKAREAMGRETEYDFDPADIARQAANEITGMDVQTSPPPLRPVNVSVGTLDPSAVRTLEQGTEKRKEGKKRPRPPKKPMPPPLVPTPELAGLPTPGNPKDDESLIPPKGIPDEVALGIRYNTNEFFPDFNSQRTWDSGKLNIRDKCSNVFLKKNWEAWRKLAKPPCGNPPKAEVRKSFLHYAGLELHGVKVDWSTVDLSIALNTISRERRLAARREVYRMKVKMDGRLVEPVDPDEADKSQKRKKKPASTQEGAPKRPKSEPKPKPSVPPVVAEEQGETFSRKGRKVDGFPTQPPVDTVAEERLMIKLAVKASRLDSFVDPSLPTPTGQTSGRGSNQMSAADFTTQVNQNSGNLPCVESIDPNTGEKEVMDEEVNAEELEAGRGRHIIRNDVDVLNDNESRRFALLEATAENLPKSNSWKEYMTDFFDSYVNPDNDPDVRPLVAGLDAEDFSAEKIPGAAIALTPDDDGPDYETSLSERQRLKIQSDLLATAAEPQRMTRSTRTWLEYEPVLL
ncbi:hypothetical protein R1sor_024576 [Riccia sorocarpa]|uniref:Uncharacterized protein n=1 Tax=Riccia sorocarpa TaxID=122646 RepID=A0ABD3GU26_9MARC